MFETTTGYNQLRICFTNIGAAATEAIEFKFRRYVLFEFIYILHEIFITLFLRHKISSVRRLLPCQHFHLFLSGNFWFSVSERKESRSSIISIGDATTNTQAASTAVTGTITSSQAPAANPLPRTSVHEENEKNGETNDVSDKIK